MQDLNSKIKKTEEEARKRLSNPAIRKSIAQDDRYWRPEEDDLPRTWLGSLIHVLAGLFPVYLGIIAVAYVVAVIAIIGHWLGFW